MCDFSTAALVITALGAATSGVAAYQQGQATKKTGEYNAEMANRARKDTLIEGSIVASEKRERARQIAGTQIASFGVAGLDPTVGTPGKLLEETTTMGELDALRTLNNAERKGSAYSAQSELDLFQGKAAGRAGMLNAGATLLAGASNTYSAGRKFGKWS